MEAGGWATPAMLKRYVHLGPSTVWQAVEKLAEETGGKAESRPSQKEKESGHKYGNRLSDYFTREHRITILTYQTVGLAHIGTLCEKADLRLTYFRRSNHRQPNPTRNQKAGCS